MSLKIIAPPEKTSLTTKGPSYLHANLPRESGVICRTFRRTRSPGLNLQWRTLALNAQAILCCLHYTVHLGTVWSGVAMMHFESLTELVDDPVIQVLGIVGDDRLGDSVSGDDVTLEKCATAFAVTEASVTASIHLVK
ncbi:hypothetical protein CRG98_030028 [Punica granatum]|uniref:Uncharacterized protein n=1 Tax=Punica granatum TaxID=22663 RepID=A0A2I0J015_PUNGR|nr:hypothetical protein CRG98_030028 [Punica granatum]